MYYKDAHYTDKCNYYSNHHPSHRCINLVKDGIFFLNNQSNIHLGIILGIFLLGHKNM